MAKYKLTKPCYYGERLYKAGDIVDFGSDKAPKSSVEVPGIVEKAKAAVAAKTPDAVVAQEDKLLKGSAEAPAAAPAEAPAAAPAAAPAEAPAAVPGSAQLLKGAAK